MISYQTARAKMIREEKKFREQLEHTTNELNSLMGISELGPSELASLIIKAVRETQLYVKQQGFNGYLYDTERVRQNLVDGFSSKGKQFQNRLYRLTALEIGVELLDSPINTHRRRYLYNLVFGAAHNDQGCINELAHLLNWERNFSPRSTRDRSSRSTPSSYKSKFAGARYERPPDKPKPPKPPVVYTRRLNEWAYKEAKVSTQLIPLTETWNEILNIEPTALWYEIKAAVRKLAVAHHSDKGGSEVAIQRILAAYDVAKKIYNLR